MYDSDGCLLLLSAIVRIWWRDALRSQTELAELATFLEVKPADLAGGPPPYRTPRNNYADHLSDRPEPTPAWPLRRRGPYRRYGIGD